MSVPAAGVAPAVLVALAVLVLPRRREEARERVQRLRRHPAVSSGRPGLRAGRPHRGDVAGLAEHLASAFRAGLAPARAWAVLAARPGSHTETAQAVLPWLDLGVSPGYALFQAVRPPAASLVALAVALDLCERTGAPTAEVLDGLAAALRAEAAAAQDRQVALAAPRASARVMSVLPAAGLGMAGLLGADSVRVLTTTSPGRLCLVLGGAFWAAGHWWIRRLVRAAGRGERGEG